MGSEMCIRDSNGTYANYPDFTAITGLIFAILWVAYYTLLIGPKSQTLGSRLTRTRVITRDNRPVSRSISFQRALYSLVSLIVFGAGYWIAFSDPQHRTFHDRLAGTLVVKA